MTALITPEDIINDVLLDVSDFSNNEYMRALRFVERGVGEINLFHSKEYKIVKLTINENLTATLPDDYVRHSMIGVLINNQIYPLSSNNENVNTGENKTYKDTSYRLGHKGGLSAYGEYTINQSQHRIEFSKNIVSLDVYLKYISTGLESDKKIPVIYRETLIAYVKWKLEKDVNLRMVLEREYYQEVGKLRESLVPTMHEVYDAILSGQSITPKR
jgi:hypothetical protein